MPLDNQHILITSNEPWGDIWYSKQNYAYELSKKNKVTFINPPTQWKIKNLLKNKVVRNSISQSLESINYENYLPILNNFFNRLNNWLVSRLIKNYLEQQGTLDYILWAFDPVRLYDHRLLGAYYGIYHCVDYYYFNYYGEHQLCKNSDIIFATSKKFLDEYHEYNKPKYLVPHGISKEEFYLDEKQLNTISLPAQAQTYGLYIGVIDHRLDFELLENVVKKFSLIPFVFIGPLRLPENNEEAKRLFIDAIYPNVHPVGPRHFKTLKYYVSQCKFCISFMDMSYHANTVHHHKTLTYLAQGKPVFGPTFEEYKEMEKILYMEDQENDMIKALESFLTDGENENLTQLRVKYAMKFTFENILSDVDNIIELATNRANEEG